MFRLISAAGRAWWLPALAGATFGAACMIKLFVLPAIVPIAALLLAPAWGGLAERYATNRQKPTRAQVVQAWRESWPTLARASGGFMGIILLLFFTQANLGAEWGQMIGLHARAAATFGSRLDNVGTFAGMWWDAPLILAGGYAAWLGWKHRRWPALLLGAWGILCILVLAAQVPLFSHHLALIPPPFILAVALLPELMQEEHGTRHEERKDLKETRSGGNVFSPSPALLGRKPRGGAGVIPVVLLGIAFITSFLQQNAAIQHPPADVMQVANDLSVLTQPGDLVVTDDQMIAVLADREIPAPLVDTSNVRIASGALTMQEVVKVAADPRVTALIWYSGRFDHLPGLRDWVTRNFIRVIDYGGGRALYLRAPPATGPAKG